MPATALALHLSGAQAASAPGPQASAERQCQGAVGAAAQV